MNNLPNILIVDDREENLFTLEQTLKGNEATFIRALSGNDALMAALNYDFAVAIIDIQMPEMDGYELAECLRGDRRTQSLPILFVSAVHSDEYHIFKGYEAGAVDFLRKPYDRNILESKVRIFLDLYQQRVELEQEVMARKEAEKSLQALNENLENLVAERTDALQAKTEEAQMMSTQLWQSSKLATMGELNASIAHELANPLQIIGLYIESLMEEFADNELAVEELGTVQKELDRMSNLVANLLESSRQHVQQISTIAISEEIESTLNLVQSYLKNRRIEVQTEFAEGLPKILADRHQLRQVFLNLITNAADAMEGGGTLTVRADVIEESDPPQISIELEDDGPGIPADILPKIVESFFTTKPVGKGTGLGLPICRRIIEEYHHGKFEIDSEIGRGTTFNITLPLQNSDSVKQLD
jgi:signal transduction histidine kinase